MQESQSLEAATTEGKEVQEIKLDDDESHFRAVEILDMAESSGLNESSSKEEDPIINMLAKLTMTPEGSKRKEDQSKMLLL